MGQWGEFTVKNATLYLHLLPWPFLVFHQKNFFLLFHHFFFHIHNFFPNAEK